MDLGTFVVITFRVRIAGGAIALHHTAKLDPASLGQKELSLTWGSLRPCAPRPSTLVGEERLCQKPVCFHFRHCIRLRIVEHCATATDFHWSCHTGCIVSLAWGSLRPFAPRPSTLIGEEHTTGKVQTLSLVIDIMERLQHHTCRRHRTCPLSLISFCGTLRIGEADRPGPYSEGGSTSSGYIGHYDGTTPPFNLLPLTIPPTLPIEEPVPPPRHHATVSQTLSI